MNKLKALVILVPLLFLSSPSQATFGVGGYVPFAGSVQKDTDGGRNTFEFEPFVSFNAYYPLSAPHFLYGEIGSTIPQSETYHKRQTVFLLYNLAYQFAESSFFTYGLGTFITRVWGDGGAVTVQNGSGTATAYRPKKTQKSYNTTLNAGLEQFIGVQWSLKGQLYYFAPLSWSKKKISYTLSVHYYL